MNYSPRIKKISICFALLGLLLLLTAGYRMIWQREALSRRVYRDGPMEALFQELAAEGIISPMDRSVHIDLNRLRARVDQPGIRQFILDRQSYLTFEGDRLVIDPAAISVSNRRGLYQTATSQRGRILDRHGVVLARTVSRSRREFKRQYPLGPVMFPILGIVHPVYGEKGLERFLDPWLEGRQEESLWRRCRRWFTAAERQCDVVLTLDAGLQQAAFSALGNQTGAVVVLDTVSGDILVAASTPSFDPATPSGYRWDAAADEGYRGPFINRAFERRYPPGSTFKLVTAAAWMEHGGADASWGMECKGRHPRYGIREYKGERHGWVDLRRALALSCNVFFADIGARLGPALADTAERFGFNRQWYIFGKTQGDDPLLVSRAFTGHPTVAGGGRWTPINFQQNPRLVAQGAVGQNVVAATPLQMAMVAGALANGGNLMKPRLIQAIRHGTDQDAGTGPEDRVPVPESAGRACSQKTARAILSMMAGVMDRGTGARLKKIYRQGDEYIASHTLPKGKRNLVGGKSGTAETIKGSADHAWFVTVAPLDKPRYAVAVLIEHGGLGAKAAGPVAVEVMVAALNRGHR